METRKNSALFNCAVIVFMIFLTVIIATNTVLAKRSKVVNQGKPYYKWVKGYASGLPKYGVSFKHGGQLWWSDSKKGASVSVSAGAGYGALNISLGIASQDNGKGVAVEIPASKHYYKVYVKKKIKLQKYKVYVWRWDPRLKKERWMHSSNGIKNLGVYAKRYEPKRVCPNGAHKCK